MYVLPKIQQLLQVFVPLCLCQGPYLLRATKTLQVRCVVADAEPRSCQQTAVTLWLVGPLQRERTVSSRTDFRILGFTSISREFETFNPQVLFS